MTDKYWRICEKCGKELYPKAKVEGAITVSMGKCPRYKPTKKQYRKMVNAGLEIYKSRTRREDTFAL